MNHSSRSTASGSTPRAALSLLAGLALSLPLPSLFAQPGPPDGEHGLGDFAASYSFSSEGDVERNGKLGTVSVSHYEFEASVSLPGPETWMFSTGLSWKRDEFDLTGAVPLPKKLEELGFNFRAMKDLTKEFGPGWSAMAMLNPSFSADAVKISGDSLSVFGLASFSKEVSPTFSWSFGLVGMTRGDMKVLPLLGLHWSFAPDWELAVGFPDTGITWKFSEALTLSAGASMQGGTYYISKAPAAGLGDTYLDYREARAGLTAEYRFSKKLSLVVEGGLVIDRTYDYDDRGIKLKGESANYGSFGLRYSF